MNWLLKIASPEEYLATLGAPPMTIQWIMSQPNPQFFINEFRKNPGIDVTTLQPPQKQEYEPTQRELQRVSIFAEEEEDILKWSLVQLRKFRVRPNPLQYDPLKHGTDDPAYTMDYDYSIGMTEFDNKLREIADWYRMSNYESLVDISSYSWDQAVAASDEWHAVSAGKGSGNIYEPLNPELVAFAPKEWEGWSIQKVVSENDLLVEGNRMSHCVGDYCRQVEHGATEIYSLRDPKNEPHVTVEIDPKYNEVVQIMGNSNSEPNAEYKAYIKQWFEVFQKERPGLKLGAEDAFDFDNLRYVENSKIDEELNRIVYQGNGYGLKTPLNELDIENAYDAVMHELTRRNSSDTRYVGYIGPAIASAAWEADKYRANQLGVIQSLEGDPKYKSFNPDERLNMLKEESGRLGVDWLWSKIEKNNESFYDYFDIMESYVNREEFETEEEYEEAQQREHEEHERSVRSESMPYALDDEIATALVKLAREDPFLPEHAQFQVQEEAKTASKTWHYVYASPEAWLRQQGIPDEILQYALNDNHFPRKMQKWVALQLTKAYKSESGDGFILPTTEDPNAGSPQKTIDRNIRNLTEIRDWFNHKSATERGFDINRFTLPLAAEQADIWQAEMADKRGEGHARDYTQPDYNAEDLGNGFRMVEVVPDDLENEGAIMQHCIGDDAQDYREKVESGNSKIFSLRDSRGWPHATIEIQNENEFDVEDFDNDPENWIHDEAGNLVDIDYEAYGDRSAQWVVAQIQGKQNEPPVDKYRPFLKAWLEGHPEFNPSEDDLLSVTPSPELLQAIINDTNEPSDDGVYRKYSAFLDEEDQVRLIGQIINDQGVGWSNEAISDAISKPIINGWFDEPDEESAAAAGMRFLGWDNPGVMNREKHNTFVRSLTSHDSPDVRRTAYSRMSADSRYRTPEGLQEFMQAALQEPSAKVVAMILPNFFTYPNKDSPNSMEKYRSPTFGPGLFSFAMQLSEKFKGAPDSQELHSKIVIGLTPQANAQMIAQAVTNQFVGQRIGDGSTYELRHALEKMDTSRFGEVWALLDPTLRKFMLSEEIKGYNTLVNKHREVIDQYPGETALRPGSGQLAPPGYGTVYQPEVQDIPITHTQNMPPPQDSPSRDAVSNWLTKIASVELMYHGTSDALAPKILSEGLDPGRDLVWDTERAKKDQRSRESYGGIYLTNNFMTAWGAARTATEQFGGGRLMTISQVELRSDSLLQDEDKVLDPRGTFDRVMGVSANDYFYMQWAANDFYNLEKIAEKYLDEISLNYTTGEPRPGFEDPRQREALKPSVIEFIKATVMREIAIAVEQERESQFPSLKYKYPQFSEMQLPEAEAEYRNSANELMQKTRFLTNTISDFSHNVRTMEPISFRGKNKIVLIAKIHESTYDSETRTNHYVDDKYNDDAEILYASDSKAIQMLIGDMQEKIGGGLRVRDKNTVYLDNPRES